MGDQYSKVSVPSAVLMSAIVSLHLKHMKDDLMV